ncbi:hypothetical protein F511_10355 [Dorcoceras hygrometricum]|uniref:Uncharacterized protein n=1 Tax=Dorcoceras hygrometricum TaxID=472368 RepID=A0A2Z7CVJ8_9LAMI|nr:hypothetical protein F511_10355 [Dorcoceras hygrometricum]
MAFGTYVVLSGLSLGLHGKFSPEAVNWLFAKGVVGWTFQVTLLKMTLFSLGSGEAPLLDIVAYAGYTFYWTVSSYLGKIILEIHILLHVAMDVFVHGNFLGEDYEEGFFCSSEDLRFEQASLSSALHCLGTISTTHLAWKH